MLTTEPSVRRRLYPGALRRSRHKPTFAQPGTVRDATYRTGPQDCVQTVGPGPEWSNKPAVVASCAVIRLCEELCMIALLDTMPEGYCSLGTRQHLGHLGPIAIGAEIAITARCVRARGRYSSWEVTVRDSHEVVGQGRMDFVAVHRPRYEAHRLAPKRAALEAVHP
jgi:predicted thioesterase